MEYLWERAVGVADALGGVVGVEVVEEAELHALLTVLLVQNVSNCHSSDISACFYNNKDSK